MVPGGRGGQEHVGRRMHVGDRDVDRAVVVEVAEGAAASRARRDGRRAETVGDVREHAVARVAVHDLPLFVRGFRRNMADLRIHVSVGEEDVEPAVVVEVGEAGAPPQPPRVHAEPGVERPVLAEAVAAVRVERRGVAGEVRLDDVERAVAVEVADADAHARLRLAVLAERALGADADVLERAVAAVPEQRARVRVVRHVDVRPPVIVEVERRDAEAVGAARLQDAGLLRDVGEAVVTEVAIERIAPAGQAGRPARHRHPLVAAQPRFGRRRVREIEIDVVGDEEVEAAVPVVVDEGAAGIPARARLRETRGLRDLLEPSAGVPEQPVLPVVGHQEIGVPVVVDVAGARALPPAPLLGQPRGPRDILEPAVAGVPVQERPRLLPLRKSVERRPVDEEEIEPAVVVVVEQRDAGAGRLEQVPVRVHAAEHDAAGEAGVGPEQTEAEAGAVVRRQRRHRRRHGDREGQHEAASCRAHQGASVSRDGSSRRASRRCRAASTSCP